MVEKNQRKDMAFSKLSMRYYGPFRIIDKINDVAFRLELPNHWTINNSFHVSLLKFQGEVPKDLSQEMQPKVAELDEVLEPKQILAHKDRKIRRKL